jgi:hypothetical protein
MKKSIGSFKNFIADFLHAQIDAADFNVAHSLHANRGQFTY